MANNYGGMGVGGNYPPMTPQQNVYGSGGGVAGSMRGGMPGWASVQQQPPPKANFSPMNMGAATYNQLQSAGFDGNATANWWNGPGTNMMTPGFNNFTNPPPFGSAMIGGPKMGNANQASGDSFSSPWNYGGMGQMGGGFEQTGNLTMRQQMLKEANILFDSTAFVSMGDKFAPNQQQNSSSGYSLFNTNSWNPSLTNHLRSTMGGGMGGPPPPPDNSFGPLQQSSLFANQRPPQSLAQLLEQQNQIQKTDFH